jgi:hypothetical protein
MDRPSSTTLQMTTGDTLTTGVIDLSIGNSIIDGAGTISVGDLIVNLGTISAGAASTGGTLDLTGVGGLLSFGPGVLAIGTAAAASELAGCIGHFKKLNAGRPHGTEA